MADEFTAQDIARYFSTTNKDYSYPDNEYVSYCIYINEETHRVNLDGVRVPGNVQFVARSYKYSDYPDVEAEDFWEMVYDDSSLENGWFMEACNDLADQLNSYIHEHELSLDVEQAMQEPEQAWQGQEEDEPPRDDWIGRLIKAGGEIEEDKAGEDQETKDRILQNVLQTLNITPAQEQPTQEELQATPETSRQNGTKSEPEPVRPAMQEPERTVILDDHPPVGTAKQDEVGHL